MPKIDRWILGFFLAGFLLSGGVLGADEPAPDTVSLQRGAPLASEEATPGIDSAVQMAQQEVRDPFDNPADIEAPQGGTGAVSPQAAPEVKVELQGIGFGSQDAYAVIGGEIFYAGDEKLGIKLLEVRRREVDILVNGGKRTIPLFQNEDLQRAKDRAQKKTVNTDIVIDPKPETSSS